MTDSVHSQRPMIVYSVADQFTFTPLNAETEVHFPEVYREITCDLNTGLVGLESEIGYF